jgi:hypothetical protein
MTPAVNSCCARSLSNDASWKISITFRFGIRFLLSDL